MEEDNIFKTSTGEPIPTMERATAITQGLIPSRRLPDTNPQYDYELTEPYILPTEKNMLIQACNSLTWGNRKYLVVYWNNSAQIYISTKMRKLQRAIA